MTNRIVLVEQIDQLGGVATRQRGKRKPEPVTVTFAGRRSGRIAMTSPRDARWVTLLEHQPGSRGRSAPAGLQRPRWPDIPAR